MIRVILLALMLVSCGVEDGRNGVDGAPGVPGSPGAPGAPGEPGDDAVLMCIGGEGAVQVWGECLTVGTRVDRELCVYVRDVLGDCVSML